MAAVKLFGFLVLVAAIFICAHFIGAKVGPVTTGHSQVQYTGGDAPGGGMYMGGMKMAGQP